MLRPIEYRDVRAEKRRPDRRARFRDGDKVSRNGTEPGGINQRQVSGGCARGPRRVAEAKQAFLLLKQGWHAPISASFRPQPISPCAESLLSREFLATHERLGRQRAIAAH